MISKYWQVHPQKNSSVDGMEHDKYFNLIFKKFKNLYL